MVLLVCLGAGCSGSRRVAKPGVVRDGLDEINIIRGVIFGFRVEQMGREVVIVFLSLPVVHVRVAEIPSYGELLEKRSLRDPSVSISRDVGWEDPLKK